MKILVIGGMHGNEMLGIDLVKSLQENPLENIDSVLANEELLVASYLLGLPRVIVADYDCINKYALNCVSIEISVQSRLNDVKVWRQKLQMLAEKEIADCQAVSEVEKFRFVYRITLEDKTRLNLDQANLRAFQSIDQNLAEKMGVKTPAYPIFINDKLTPYNYGGLLNKISDKN